MSTPPRAPCIMPPAAITARGTARSLPLTTSQMSSLYAVKLSVLSASYQTCASRYLSFGLSSASAHLRTRLSAASPSHSRSASARSKSLKLVPAIETPFVVHGTFRASRAAWRAASFPPRHLCGFHVVLSERNQRVRHLQKAPHPRCRSPAAAHCSGSFR